MPTFADNITDNQILLGVGVSVPDLQQEGQPPAFAALVDTGAQRTMVSSQVVAHLAATPTGIASFMPASGQPLETPEFWLNINIPIAVGSPEGSQITFASGQDLSVLLLPFDPHNFDVLLGMDLLQRYHITMWSGAFVLSN